MATFIKVPSTKDGGKPAYRAQVRYKGRTDSQTFPNKAEAKAWAAKVETEIRDGKHYAHAAARRMPFAKLIEDYTATKLVDFDETQRATRVQQLAWWAQRFEGLSLAEVAPDKISVARDALAAETFTKSPRIPEAVYQQVRALAEAGKTHLQIIAATKQSAVTVRRILQGRLAPTEYKRSPATINRYLATLSDALSFAVKERSLLDANPVSKISRKKEPRGRTRFLSDAERGALIEACAKSDWSPLHVLVLLAITTGARRGELIRLKWADVDLKQGRALVRETKNDEQRLLPLAGKALESLRALKLRNSARSEFVFAQPSGLPGPYLHFDGRWGAALEATGIGDFHFHDLRHTTASMLAAQGCSLLEIADVLGHKTLAMVKRYSHLVVDHKAKVIEKMIAAKGL
jgi:integrase